MEGLQVATPWGRIQRSPNWSDGNILILSTMEGFKERTVIRGCIKIPFPRPSGSRNGLSVRLKPIFNPLVRVVIRRGTLHNDTVRSPFRRAVES